MFDEQKGELIQTQRLRHRTAGLFWTGGCAVQTLVYIPPQKSIENRGDRNAEEDAGNAAKSRSYGDSSEDPDAGKTDGGAHNPGIDDVALHLSLIHI